MEEFNTGNIFTLPLVLRSNCVNSNNGDVNGLVGLTNANNVVQKTLLVYQDTSILDSGNEQGQPLVSFLCEVDDNNEDQSSDSTENIQANDTIQATAENLNLDQNTCSLNFTNTDLNSGPSSICYRDDIPNVVGVKNCDVDLLNGSLDPFIETVVLYQCRLCQHASSDKNDIIRHLRSFHLIINEYNLPRESRKTLEQIGRHRDLNLIPPACKTNVVTTEPSHRSVQSNNSQKEGMVILEGCKNTSEQIEVRQIRMEEDKNDETQTVYMCGRCSLPFETMAECKTHMANHPKYKGGNKISAKAPKKNNLSQLVHLTIEPAEPVIEIPESAEIEMKAVTPEEVTEGKDCPDIIKEKNIKCDKESCNLTFSTEEFMKHHTECHIPDDISRYKCSNCHYMFNKWSEVVLHLSKSHHIDLDLFKCSVCTFKSVSRLELRRHFKNHSIGDFFCMVCGKSYVAEDKFKEHSAIHKPPQDITKLTVDGTGKIMKMKVECGECGLRLSSAKTLKKHVKVVHGKLRPHMCQVCPFTSATRATLTLHMRQHTGETPFTCEHCDFKTRDHNTMRRHRIRHSIVKPYSCKLCNFTSVQSSQFKNHILRCHPESNDVFKCSDCTYTTVSQSLMISHRKVVHRDGRLSKITDEDDRDRNLSSMFPSSKSKDTNNQNKCNMEVDEESSSQCYFESEPHIDTGGITIPAEETEAKQEDTCTYESQLDDPGGGVQTTNGILVPNEDTMPLS